jgi:cell division septum initiation protein DivIVA
MVAGCGGPSAEEWHEAQQQIGSLRADLDAAKKAHADDEQRYADAEKSIQQLQEQLKAAGVELVAAAARRPESPGATLATTATAQPVPSGWKQLSHGKLAGTKACMVTRSVAFEGAGAVAAAQPEATIRTAFVKAEYESQRACPKEQWKVFLWRRAAPRTRSPRLPLRTSRRRR